MSSHPRSIGTFMSANHLNSEHLKGAVCLVLMSLVWPATTFGQFEANTDTVTIEREVIYVDREYIPPFVEMDGILYFTADDGINGEELWRSDGTRTGTRMIRDINPWGHSNPRYLTVVDGTLFFQATDEILGTELWKSDGTQAGTMLVRDINVGKPSGHPSHLTVMDGLLYFQADDGVVGIELWSSDGSTDGTQLVRDINPYTGAFTKAPHGREWEEHTTEENR